MRLIVLHCFAGTAQVLVHDIVQHCEYTAKGTETEAIESFVPRTSQRSANLRVLPKKTADQKRTHKYCAFQSRNH